MGLNRGPAKRGPLLHLVRSKGIVNLKPDKADSLQTDYWQVSKLSSAPPKDSPFNQCIVYTSRIGAGGIDAPGGDG